MPVDIAEEVGSQLLEESTSTHIALMADTKANIQAVNSVARFSGVKKFDEVGALEAAASEVVLRIKPLTS